jgi:hypothetical protein
MASSLSQRHKVVSPMEAARSCRITSCLISAKLHRDKGTPLTWGSSQASALTATMSLGGKAGWAPAARSILQAAETFFEKTFTPLADNLPRGSHPKSDFVIFQAVSGQKNNLGSNDISIR